MTECDGFEPIGAVMDRVMDNLHGAMRAREDRVTPRQAAARTRQVIEAAGDALNVKATFGPDGFCMGYLYDLLKADPPCEWEADVLPAITSAAAMHRKMLGPRSMVGLDAAVPIALRNRDERIACGQSNVIRFCRAERPGGTA